MVIQTKFDIGDDVFYMEDNKVASSIVTDINIYVSDNIFGIYEANVFYKIFDGTTISGKGLFATKQELLESL